MNLNFDFVIWVTVKHLGIWLNGRVHIQSTRAIYGLFLIDEWDNSFIAECQVELAIHLLAAWYDSSEHVVWVYFGPYEVEYDVEFYPHYLHKWWAAV